MKYSDSNKPLVCMMTNSTCYKGTRTFTPKGILWHSTGANNPNLKRYVQPSDNDVNRAALLSKIGKNTSGNDWNHKSVQAGLNFWIGKLADGTVAAVQTMPWNYRPWGCGSGSKGSCNDTHIQFEICEDALADKAYFEAVYKEACEVTAYLCKMYNIDPKGTITCGKVTKCPTILCHYDSYTLGLGTGHQDVLHWFPKFGYTMTNVRNDVAALLAGSTTTVSAASGVISGATTSTSSSTTTTEVYRVRKTWADSKSQIGAYKSLANAKAACPSGYSVFGSKGNVVYTATSSSTNTAAKPVPSITYAVKTSAKKYADVKNGAVAGNGSKILGIKIGVDYGSVAYRVHCGGKWLPKVTGNDWNDYNNGYAGDDVNAIDAIQIYYTSDRTKTDTYEAVYTSRPVGYNSYLGEIHDTNWESGDGNHTSGIFGKAMGRIKISLS